jgi:hypothetical protein
MLFSIASPDPARTFLWVVPTLQKASQRGFKFIERWTTALQSKRVKMTS